MRPFLVLPLLLALVACGDQPSVTPRASETPSASPSPSAYAADRVVLRVSYSGGLLPPNPVPFLPGWTLYGDGRVLTLGPVPAIYPGPAMPNLRVGRISAAEIDRLAAAARAAGVDGQQRDYGTPAVADASNTDVHLSDSRGTVDLSVYALHEGGEGPPLTAEQVANRKRLREFVESLTRDGAADDEEYEPTAITVYTTAYQHDDHEQGVTPNEIAWRGPDLEKGTARPNGGRCTLLTGDVLATVLPDLRRATTITRWTYGGKAYSMAIRPLLPDEQGCG